MMPSIDTHDSPSGETDLLPHARNLSWMASLAVASNDYRAAEGYLLELLALCVFAERVVDQHSD